MDTVNAALESVKLILISNSVSRLSSIRDPGVPRSPRRQ